MFLSYSGTEAVAHSLLIKRRGYRYENEVRLIYIAQNKTKEEAWLYKFKLDPLVVFDQVMIDGRVSWTDFVFLRDTIMKRTGLPRRRILRSLLYTRPKDLIVCLPDSSTERGSIG